MNEVIKCICGKEVEIIDRKGKCSCGMYHLIVPDGDILLSNEVKDALLRCLRESYDPPFDPPTIVEEKT